LEEEQEALANSYGITCDDLEDLWTGFRDRQWIINICNAVVALSFFFGVHAALVALNLHLAIADSPSGIHLLPQTAIWWFLPGFGALILPWEITIRIWSLFAENKTVRLYREWAKVDTFMYRGALLPNELGWFHFFALAIVLPVSIATLLALNMHANVGSDSIRDCGYAFKTCSVYRFADAQSLTEIEGSRATDGKLTHQAGIVIDFKDGRRWSSAHWGNFQRTVDPAFADFLTTKTGLSMNFAQTEEDIPPRAGQSVPH
jgi:hypothetical protein